MDTINVKKDILRVILSFFSNILDKTPTTGNKWAVRNNLVDVDGNAITTLNPLPTTATINGSDIEIGAVEIKNATDDTRVKVGVGSSMAVGDNAMAVADPGVRALLATIPTAYGEAYASSHDFTAVYTSTSSVTISAAPFTVDDASCYVFKIAYKNVAGIWQSIVNTHNGISLAASAGVITVTGATPFVSTDTAYRVIIFAQEKAYDSTTDSNKIIEQSPLNMKFVPNILINATNSAISAGTLLPSATGYAMDGYSGESASINLVDADGTITVTVEATNDDPTTGTWTDITKCFNDDNAGVATSIGASITVTNGTKTAAISRANLNYAWIRYRLVNTGNTNTISISTRKIY
jgi:hypothetical protein